jgi:hypothetical protein
MAVQLGIVSLPQSGNNPASLTLAIAPPVGQLKVLVAWAKFTATVITPPNGWVERITISSPVSTGGKLAVFQRFTQVGDTGAPTVTFSGGSNGNTCIAQAFSLSGVGLQNPLGSGIAGSNSSAINIGPAQLPTLEGTNGAILVFGARSDDWTSVAVLSSNPGITWSEVLESDATAGNDGGIVVNIGTWTGPAPVLGTLNKTFVVTGGAAAPGVYFSVLANSSITEAAPVVLSAQGAALAGVARTARNATGTLTAQSATVAGVGERVINAKAPRVLVAASATITAVAFKGVVSVSADLVAGEATTTGGSSIQEIYALGSVPDLVAQPADLGGVEIIEDTGTEAVIFAGSATTSTDARRIVFSIFAGLAAQSASLTGTASVGRIGTGILVADPATLFGSSERGVIVSDATLVAGSATLVGEAKRGRVGAGALTASAAQVFATTLLERKGTGVLVAGSPTMSIVGGPFIPPDERRGSGDLFGGAATVDAVAALARMASGDMQAQAASMSATTKREITLDADLFASPATIQAVIVSGVADTWESDDLPWGQPPVIHARYWPVFVKDKSFYQAEITSKFDGDPVRVILERSGLTILGRDRQGNWKNEPGTIKFVTGIWPLLRGTPGSVVKIYVGGQMTTEEPIKWEGPYQAIVGETEFLDFTVSGRYISLRFESEAQPPWELVSYDLELTQVGSR